MVDREARDRLATALEGALEGEVTYDAFDELRLNPESRTEDCAVLEATAALWDSCSSPGKKLAATREEWDLYHRILLLLRSDAELEVTTTWRWTPRQWLAVGALAAFVFGYFGDSAIVVPAWLLGAGVSIGISRWRARDRRRARALERQAPGIVSDSALWPFASVSELLRTRRAVKGFVKRAYPQDPTRRREVAPLDPDLYGPYGIRPVFAAAVQIFALPFALIAQAWPEEERKRRVVVQQAA